MKVSAIMHDSFDLKVFRSSFIVHRDGLLFLPLRQTDERLAIGVNELSSLTAPFSQSYEGGTL